MSRYGLMYSAGKMRTSWHLDSWRAFARNCLGRRHLQVHIILTTPMKHGIGLCALNLARRKWTQRGLMLQRIFWNFGRISGEFGLLPHRESRRNEFAPFLHLFFHSFILLAVLAPFFFWPLIGAFWMCQNAKNKMLVEKCVSV